MNLFRLVDATPRRTLLLVAVACVCMLGFGLYLQQVVGLEPCPMCIVQRDAMILVALVAGLSALGRRSSWRRPGAGLAALFAIGGAFVAARQSWIQWYPPEPINCGRDLYGMIATFPLERVIPMIFKGNGDCSKVDWTFLGGSIANWSFVCFVGMTVLLALVALRRPRSNWGLR